MSATGTLRGRKRHGQIGQHPVGGTALSVHASWRRNVEDLDAATLVRADLVGMLSKNSSDAKTRGHHGHHGPETSNADPVRDRDRARRCDCTHPSSDLPRRRATRSTASEPYLQETSRVDPCEPVFLLNRTRRSLMSPRDGSRLADLRYSTLASQPRSAATKRSWKSVRHRTQSRMRSGFGSSAFSTFTVTAARLRGQGIC